MSNKSKKFFKSKIMSIGIIAIAAALIIPTAVVLSAKAADNSIDNAKVSSSDELSDDQAVLLQTEPTTNQTVSLQSVEGLTSHDLSGAPSFHALAYSGNYRGELTDDQKELYDILKAKFREEKFNGEFAPELKEPITMEYSEPIIGLTKEQYTPIIDNAFDLLDSKLFTDMSAASRALVYDYPEMFWLDRVQWSYAKAASNDYAYIKKFTISPIVYYDSAYSQIDEFERGVNAAVDTLNAQLTSSSTKYQKAKVIHDYICNTMEYDFPAAETGGAAYKYAHTAAPLFVTAPSVFLTGEKVFVCEGYAKAFKILGDRLGVSSCIIIGLGAGGGHMWNYVKADNNLWYGLDATWDDQSSYISDKYFFCGKNSVCFNGQTFGQDHLPDPYLNTSYEFEYPSLSLEKYDPNSSANVCDHNYTLITKNALSATCTAKGYTGDKYCSNCGELVANGVATEVVPHSFTNYISNNDATCTADGTKTAVCDTCKTATDTITDTGTKKEHSYGDWEKYSETQHKHVCINCKNEEYADHRGGTATYDTQAVCEVCGSEYGSMLVCSHNFSTVTKNAVAATCTTQGYTGDKYCSNCGELVANGVATEVVPHSFTNYISNNNATCTADGTKTAVCDTCNTAKDTVTDAGTKLAHAFGEWTGFDEQKHKHVCITCQYEEYADHRGGTATYDTQAVCEVCGSSYGALIYTEIKLHVDKVTLFEGEAFDLVAYTYPAETDETVKWTSSNEAVAVVNNNGRITALSRGKATITATINAYYSATAVVTVSPRASKPTVGVVINKSSLRLEIHRNKLNPTASLSAKITGTSTGKLWFSDNINVATVGTTNGKVTAISEGVANIYCRTADGTISEPCRVTVGDFRIDSTNMHESIVYVNAGDTCRVDVTSDLNHGDIAWKSSSPAVAKIDQNGVVTAYKKGTVTITATAADKTKDTVKLIVVAASESVQIKKTEAAIYTGKTISLGSALGTKGSNEPVFWSTSNKALATVNSKGVVKGIRQGKVTITATTFNGKKSYAVVTVMTKAVSLEFTQVTPALYLGGNQGTFTVAVTDPANCNDAITWASSNKKVIEIVSVSSDGKTAVVRSGSVKGTATITAKAGSGKKVTYKVTAVNFAAKDMTVTPASADIYVGRNVTLKSKITIAEKGCNDIIIWSSSNPAVASVDQNGKVIGKAPGVVTIYADSFGGMVHKQITVTVRSRA